MNSENNSRWNKGDTQKHLFADVFKISFLKNFSTFTRKYLCWSLFLIKVQAFRAATLLLRYCKHTCFPVSIAKFLRTALLQTSGACFWVQQPIEGVPRNTLFKIPRTTCCAIKLCRYEGLCPAAKTEIHGGCFPRNWA